MSAGSAWRNSLARFYTHGRVAERLVHEMGDVAPARVLDLGSGSGSLTAAVGRRWPDAAIVTVDADRDAQARDLFTTVAGAHVVSDALDVGLPAVVGERDFDAVVSNPPYGTVPWRPGFLSLFAEAGLGTPFEPGRMVPAEAVFLAQAVRLAARGALAGLILPDIAATGRDALKLRQALLATHRVVRVVQLPRRSFLGTDAQAFIVVLRTWMGPTASVSLSSMSVADGRGADLKVDAAAAARRLDHAHHSAGRAAAATLGSLGAEIRRGLVETTGIASAGAPVFHSTDFPAGDARASHVLPGKCPGEGASEVVAAPGDILLARIGRSLHNKVCLVEDGWAVLTSSVLRVRVPEPARSAVAAALLSAEGAAALSATARGTGARMIAKSDLLSMPLPLAAVQA